MTWSLSTPTVPFWDPFASRLLSMISIILWTRICDDGQPECKLIKKQAGVLTEFGWCVWWVFIHKQDSVEFRIKFEQRAKLSMCAWMFPEGEVCVPYCLSVVETLLVALQIWSCHFGTSKSEKFRRVGYRLCRVGIPFDKQVVLNVHQHSTLLLHR